MHPDKQLKRTRNPLAAYAERPHGVRFDDQKPTEEVKLLLRKHYITNLKWAVLFIGALFFPSLFYIAREWSGANIEWFRQQPIEVIDALSLMWYVWVIGFTLEAFFIWYYSVYLITNYRVVDSDFNGLLHYASTEAALHQIQDVTHSQSGVWQLLFNYGDVRVQTAGSKEDITFEKVPKPAQVADILTDLLPKPDDFTYPDSIPDDERKTLPRDELYTGRQKTGGRNLEADPLKNSEQVEELENQDQRADDMSYRVQRGGSRKEYKK